MANMKEPSAPAKRALAVLDEAPSPATTERPKRISKRITSAIDLMVSGDAKTIKDAAERVGLARESALWRAAQKERPGGRPRRR